MPFPGVGASATQGSGDGQQRRQVQRIGRHGKPAGGVTRPLGGRTIPIELDAIAIRIPEIDRPADAVVSRAFEPHPEGDRATHGAGQLRRCRIEEGDMIKARGPSRRLSSAPALPSIQADVVVIAIGGEEDSLGAITLGYFQADGTLVESRRALKVGHLEVDVSDAETNRRFLGAHAHILSQTACMANPTSRDAL